MDFKYTHQATLTDGSKVWRFIPPDDARASGVVTNQTFRDGRIARHEIPKLLELIRKFRSGDIVVGSIGAKSTLKQVVTYYKNTIHFDSLSRNSQQAYHYALGTICNTKVFGKDMGGMSLVSLNAQYCSEAYDTWAEDVSISNANTLSRILSVLLRFCVSLDILPSNPMSKVKKRTHTPRSVVWTNKQVELFLDTAFSKFDWRNIGLLVLLAYEYGQRPVDIRNLKWSDINFEEGKITITQSKRGATIYLPIDDKIMDLLKQQENDWGWQEYVIPHQRPSDGAYRPFSCGQVSRFTNEVKAVCGLPIELQAGDLRKTAIVEMIGSGVDNLAIMSVTGHKNVQSLNPYNKHNFETAKSALSMRKK